MSSHNSVGTDLNKKSGQKFRSKANYVVWQVGLISRNFSRTTRRSACTCSLRTCTTWSIRLLFVWVWDTVTPSPHELKGLQKPKSKCQSKLSWCFCWLKSKGEPNKGSHICQTHPSWRVSQKSSNLGIRKGEPPVERHKVKRIRRPSQHASLRGQEVQFQGLMLHSTSCLDCDLTGMLLLKCEINI